jgi:hypothetical protein
LLYQYSSSPKLRDLVLAITAEYCTLQEVLLQLQTRLDIDQSRGQQLDLIGEIVGQPRPKILTTIGGQIFGFDPIVVAGVGFPSGDSPDFGWSGAGRPDKGGRFSGEDGAVFEGTMTDSDYRTLLRARIYSNKADVTIDSIGEFLTVALRSPGHSVHNNTPAVGSVELVTSHPISSVQEQILTALAPVAAGVAITIASAEGGGAALDFRFAFNSQYLGLLMEDI